MSTLKIAVVQYDIQWLKKAANLTTLRQMIGAFFKDSKAINLMLLPETFSTGFCTSEPDVRESVDGGDDLLFLKEVATTYNCVVAGSVFVAQAEKKVNRFYWVWPDGQVAYYDKRHLFRLGKENDFVIQGHERKIIEVNGIRILPQVCYDLRFPVWSRNLQDYDMMVNVANWPAVRRSAWEVLLKARAIENQAYVVGVNRVGTDGRGVAHSGGSIILDYLGEPLEVAEDNCQQIITAELNFSALKQFKQDFPFYLDADEFKVSQ
ncbi:MAG: amidohydrolase [Xanthomonadales bacterium]|nr:amidohydrolase [Xanthomonadales bacterium]